MLSIKPKSIKSNSLWGCSSAGRASDLHSEGRRFDPCHLHHLALRELYHQLRPSDQLAQGAERPGFFNLHHMKIAASINGFNLYHFLAVNPEIKQFVTYPDLRRGSKLRKSNDGFFKIDWTNRGVYY